MLEAILRKFKGREKISSGNYGELVTAIHEGDIQPGDLIEVNDDLTLLFEYMPRDERVTGWKLGGIKVTGNYDQWTYRSGEWRGKTHSNWGDRSDLIAKHNAKKPMLFGYLNGDSYTGVMVGHRPALFIGHSAGREFGSIGSDGHYYMRSFGERFMEFSDVQTWRNLGPVTLEQNREKWKKQSEATYEEVTKAQTY